MAAYTRIAIACLFFSLISPCLNAQSITWQRTLDTISNSIFYMTVESSGNVYASIGSGAFGNRNKMIFAEETLRLNILRSFNHTSIFSQLILSVISTKKMCKLLLDHSRLTIISQWTIGSFLRLISMLRS